MKSFLNLGKAIIQIKTQNHTYTNHIMRKFEKNKYKSISKSHYEI